MAQTIAAISNVHSVEVSHSEFNITVSQGINPDDIRQITAWLTPREIQIDIFSKRTPETGIWFIESAEYQTWLSNASGFLWVNGSPGAGKTVLSSIIIDHLQERFSSDPETAIVFAYCRYTDICSVTDIFASFIKQLVQDHPSVLPIIKDVYLDHQRKETRLCERKLQELLQELLTSFKKTYIAIDALDEVSDDTRATLLTDLSLLRASRASLLFTSRPLHLFEPHVPDAYVQVEAKNQKDIELFIDKQIKETPRLRVVLEGKQHDREMISVKLKDKSQGMFLLTALQIDGLKGCTTIKKLRGAIESLPSGLNALYECTCSRIKSQTEEEVSLATKAIIWLTYAYRSMKITELQHALAVSDGFDEEDIAAKEMIVSVCCGLIVVDEQSGIVRLVHFTAYDFFKKFPSHLCATPHTLITTSCLAYLSAFDFVEQDLSSERELEEFLSTQPLLRYAYDHWGSHSKACRGEAGLPTAVFTLLDQLDVYPYLSSSFDLLSPVHIGATYGFLDSLPVAGDSCNQVTGIRRYTPLILASANGHEEIVEFLLSRHDVDINSQGEKGRTALFEACENGHGGTVELLLCRNDVHINSEDADGQTALFAASKKGDEEIVKLLLSRKDVDINIATDYSPFGDPNGQTALFSASMNGHEEVVKLLLSRSDIDINITTKYSIFGDASGQTALFAASKNGHEGIVRLLLSRTDLNVHSRTEYGETSLFAASEEGHDEIVKLLLSRRDLIINTSTTEYGPSSEPRGRTPLFAASENGHEAVVELFLSREDINIHLQTEDGQTALFVAAKNGHEGIVELFLSRDDVDLNSQHAGGRSALFAASENSCEEVVKLLLSRTDVDVNITTKSSLFGEPSGQTALFAACRKGHRGIVEMLLSRNNVDINTENADGQTALFAASERGHEGIVKLLLSRTDVSINTTTTTTEPRGQTALFAACKNGHEGTVELLLSRNDIDIHTRTENGQTALFVASQKGREKIVKLFLSRDDVDLNLQNADCQSALFAASENNREGVVKLLLSRTDVDVNITTKNISFGEPNGQTSLFAASKNGYEGVVKLLLSRSDVDVNITTKYNPFGEAGGQTALFAASENGHEGVVKLLLSRPDVNVSITTKYNPFGEANGQTALFAASKNGHEGIVELLLSRNDIDIHSKTGDGQTSLFAATKNGHEGIVQLLLSRAFRAARLVSLASHLS